MQKRLLISSALLLTSVNHTLQAACIPAKNAQCAGADLSGQTLSGLQLDNINLQGANLRHADLRHVDLRGASIRYATFQGTHMDECKACPADWMQPKHPVK